MSIVGGFLTGTVYAMVAILNCEIQRGRELPMFPHGARFWWVTLGWPLDLPLTLYRRWREPT